MRNAVSVSRKASAIAFTAMAAILIVGMCSGCSSKQDAAASAASLTPEASTIIVHHQLDKHGSI